MIEAGGRFVHVDAHVPNEEKTSWRCLLFIHQSSILGYSDIPINDSCILMTHDFLLKFLSQVIYTTAGGALANLLHKMTDDEDL